MALHEISAWRRGFAVSVVVGCLALHAAAASGGEKPGPPAQLVPLFEKQRPDWEIQFADARSSVMSVMPGESNKSFFDPLIRREVRWEQDVYCPTFTVFGGKLHCVYRAFGEDSQWRFGLASSDDGLHFTRSDKPVLYGKPDDAFLGSLRSLKDTSVSFGDAKIYVGPGGTFYLLFNYFSLGKVNIQQLAIATSRDLVNWTHHGRIFAKQAAEDASVIPEKAPWRFPHPAIVYRLEGERFVAAKIRGKYWMYLNCLSTKGPMCVCAATSENLLDWEVLRDARGRLVSPLPLRPGHFDSDYIDTTAALLRNDGILLIYNGINADPKEKGDPRLKHRAHYPAQALFDKNDPTRLLKRSRSPFKGGDAELEKQPIVFWCAELYESWSLVPWKGELLLYWNHGFGRRAVGLWKALIPENVKNVSDAAALR
jgi:beta-1,2-mannosidase